MRGWVFCLVGGRRDMFVFCSFTTKKKKKSSRAALLIDVDDVVRWIFYICLHRLAFDGRFC